jgi:hypothetical protein
MAEDGLHVHEILRQVNDLAGRDASPRELTKPERTPRHVPQPAIANH